MEVLLGHLVLVCSTGLLFFLGATSEFPSTRGRTSPDFILFRIVTKCCFHSFNSLLSWMKSGAVYGSEIAVIYGSFPPTPAHSHQQNSQLLTAMDSSASFSQPGFVTQETKALLIADHCSLIFRGALCKFASFAQQESFHRGIAQTAYIELSRCSSNPQVKVTIR